MGERVVIFKGSVLYVPISASDSDTLFGKRLRY